MIMMNAPNSSAQAQANKAENVGRWTSEEHATFLKGVELYGKAWKKIAAMIASRTVVQVRTHAQKYFQKLVKANESGQALTPESENLEPRLITTSIAQSPAKAKAKEIKKIVQKSKPFTPVSTTTTTKPTPPASKPAAAKPAVTKPVLAKSTVTKPAPVQEKKRPITTPVAPEPKEAKKAKYSSPAIQTQLSSSNLYLSEGSPTSICDVDAVERLPLSLGEVAYSPFKFPSGPSLSASLLHDDDNDWLSSSFVTEEPEDSVLSLHSVDDIGDLHDHSTHNGDGISVSYWGEPFDSDSFLNSQDLIELHCPF